MSFDVGARLRAVRAAHGLSQRQLAKAAGAISYRQVGRSLRGRALQMIHERYAPGADTGRALLSHEGEEAGVVVRGRIEVTVAGQRRILGPGEAYAFDSRLPHR